MTARDGGKALLRRARADTDVEEAIDHHFAESPQAALDFIDSLERAYESLRRRPAIGAPRYAHELNLPGLRFWRCKRFPYLIFYVEHAFHVEVWRVLHANRDIPRWLADDSDESVPR